MIRFKKHKRTFVLVVPRFEDILNSYYASELIKGACFAASRLDVDLLVHIVSRKSHRNWLDSSLLDRHFIDGTVFADIDNDVNVVKKVISYGIPCIVLNNMLNIPINCIGINNKTAALEAVDHFAKLGHARIATIAGDLTTQAGLLRLEGFKEGLLRHKINLPKKYITNGQFLRTPAREAAEKLLKLKARPTAIFAASDLMALEVVDVAKKNGLKVPEDLSVIGFDNNPLSEMGTVKLTTFAQPIAEMGRLGVESLSRICQGKERLPFKNLLEAKLVKRKSTKKPK